MPGQQFIGHDARGVDIAARAGVSVAHLLGGQVGGGTENDAGGSDSGFGDGAHQPEVDDLDLALIRDQHVLGFDVAVYQSGAMRGGQPTQYRAQDRCDRMRWHGTAFGQELAQRAALDELHHQEWVPGVQALVVNSDEPGIFEPGHGAGLQLEAGQELLVAGVAGIHHLQGDWPIQTRVEAAVHRRGAAGGDLGRNSVAPVQQSALEEVVARCCSHGPIVGGAAVCT